MRTRRARLEADVPALFDNSILVEIRASKGASVCAEKVKFVERSFNKLQIGSFCRKEATQEFELRDDLR